MTAGVLAATLVLDIAWIAINSEVGEVSSSQDEYLSFLKGSTTFAIVMSSFNLVFKLIVAGMIYRVSNVSPPGVAFHITDEVTSKEKVVHTEIGGGQGHRSPMGLNEGHGGFSEIRNVEIHPMVGEILFPKKEDTTKCDSCGKRFNWFYPAKVCESNACKGTCCGRCMKGIRCPLCVSKSSRHILLETHLLDMSQKVFLALCDEGKQEGNVTDLENVQLQKYVQAFGEVRNDVPSSFYAFVEKNLERLAEYRLKKFEEKMQQVLTAARPLVEFVDDEKKTHQLDALSLPLISQAGVNGLIQQVKGIVHCLDVHGNNELKFRVLSSVEDFEKMMSDLERVSKVLEMVLHAHTLENQLTLLCRGRQSAANVDDFSRASKAGESIQALIDCLRIAELNHFVSQKILDVSRQILMQKVIDAFKDNSRVLQSVLKNTDAKSAIYNALLQAEELLKVSSEIEDRAPIQIPPAYVELLNEVKEYVRSNIDGFKPEQQEVLNLICSK